MGDVAGKNHAVRKGGGTTFPSECRARADSFAEGRSKRKSRHERIDAEGKTGGGKKAFGRDVGIKSGIGEAIEVGVNGEPEGKGSIGNSPRKSSCKGLGGVGRGIDTSVEVVEKERVTDAFQHEKVGNAALFHDGMGGGGVGRGVGKGCCGSSVAREVLPIKGGHCRNTGIIPKVWGKIGRGQDARAIGMGSGSDGRVGESITELGGQGPVLKGAQIEWIGGFSAEQLREVSRALPSCKEELKDERR